MATSRLDAVYRSLLITKFFTKGWGKPDNLRRLFEFRKTVSNRDKCYKLIERDYPVTITKEETSGDCRLVEGYFLTPLERYLPGIVPPVAQKAHFQALVPLSWPQPDFRPMCLHLAGTGDHYFWRRRQLMAKPLLKEGNIGAVILENPFYGFRKPADQIRSSLHNVSDIFVMGGCLILESLVLMHWCERNQLGPFGVTGLSMGGHMASLAATNWPKPLVLVPCLSWSTASAVFLQGVMSHSINWDLLEDQYLSDGVYGEKLSKMVTVVDAAFLAGKKFAQTATQSVDSTILRTNAVKGDISHNKFENGYENLENKGTANENLEKPETIRENLEKIENNGRNVKKTAKIEENFEKTTKNEENFDNQVINKVENAQDVKPLEPHKKNFEKLKTELERLSEQSVISRSLYNKLSSNETFELDPKEVDELNKLNKDVLPHIESQAVSIDSLVRPSVSTAPVNKIKEPPNQNINEIKFNPDDDAKNVGIPKAFHSPEKLGNDRPAAENARKEPAAAKARNLTEFAGEILNGVRKASSKKIDIGKVHWRDREALQFMRGIMDECTHLSNFSVPCDTSLIIAVCAKHDAYVPRDDVGTLEEIWPGAEVRYVDAGHVSAYLLHQSMFRSCIIEAFERSRKKWKDGRHVEL